MTDSNYISKILPGIAAVLSPQLLNDEEPA